MRPNCYDCKYRGTVPGSCHSSCRHPAFAAAHSDPLGNLMGIFAGVGRVPPIQAKSKEITVEGNPRGIKSGWFNHPYNFDPVWLVKCTGFKKKEIAKKNKKEVNRND